MGNWDYRRGFQGLLQLPAQTFGFPRTLLGDVVTYPVRRFFRLRVQPKTWEAFRLLALEDHSGNEVAERLGMKVSAVFVAKRNVRKMIEEEIARLDRDA
jgi:hypothetical protein